MARESEAAEPVVTKNTAFGDMEPEELDVAPSTEPKTPVTADVAGALQESLKYLVENSQAVDKAETQGDGSGSDAVHAHGAAGVRGWLSYFFPSSVVLDKLFAYEHMGNYVIERTTGNKFFETMPIYVRVGMHLLFVSGEEFMGNREIETLLIDQSVRQGKIYDATGPIVIKHITSFIRTYSIPTQELLEQDLNKYPTFNSFFSRRLLATARPITSPDDPTIVTSPADCRLSVFESVSEAKKLWIKGQAFTIPTLLLGDDKKDKSFDSVTSDPEASVAVCRLAPQDYHRFHAPFDAECIYRKDIKGELYTVNPQAINENLNVFTQNKRSIMLLHANLGPGREKVPAAFVAVGAMLVGSIGWSKKPGEKVAKGEELGWFQYGGSTCILVVPANAGIHFDADLKTTSQKQMETLVRVGMEIGRVGAAPEVPAPPAARV